MELQNGVYEITKLLAEAKEKRNNDELQLHVLGRSN